MLCYPFVVGTVVLHAVGKKNAADAKTCKAILLAEPVLPQNVFSKVGSKNSFGLKTH